MTEEREELIKELKIFSDLIMKYPRKMSKEWLDAWIEIQEGKDPNFPQYVPIDVEMLSDEEIKEAKADYCNKNGDVGYRAEMFYVTFAENAVLQAQINKLTGGKTIFKEVENENN